MKHIILLTGIVMLWGCDALQPDKTSLHATTTDGVARPECNTCHGNPPHTGAHRFHVEEKQLACWNCHSASMHRLSSTLPLPPISTTAPGHANGNVDVIFPDSTQWPANDNPDFGDSTAWRAHQDSIPAGKKASWNANDVSCSAVGCHNHPNLPANQNYYTWHDVTVPK